ncbi:MAG: hypothetical protein ABIJ56_14875 [Pseudomonadota bacterium]
MRIPGSIGFVLSAALCCACGAAAPDRAAAGPGEEKPAPVEFILSNLCSLDVAITDVTLVAGKFEFHKHFPPPQATQEDGGGGGGGRPGIRYGQEAYLADERFFAGTYQVLVRLELDSRGGNRETLESRVDMAVAGGPATVEISISADGDGCALAIDISATGSSDEKCLEPRKSAPEPDQPCLVQRQRPMFFL